MNRPKRKHIGRTKLDADILSLELSMEHHITHHMAEQTPTSHACVPRKRDGTNSQAPTPGAPLFG